MFTLSKFTDFDVTLNFFNSSHVRTTLFIHELKKIDKVFPSREYQKNGDKTLKVLDAVYMVHKAHHTIQISYYFNSLNKSENIN